MEAIHIPTLSADALAVLDTLYHGTCQPVARGSIPLKCCGGTFGGKWPTANCLTPSRPWSML